MGTWARRVIEIKMEDPSFKFEDESKLIDFLNEEIEIYGSLHDGAGVVDIPLNVLRKALKLADELHLSENTIKCLKRDLRSARLNKDETITYSCF